MEKNRNTFLFQLNLHHCIPDGNPCQCFMFSQIQDESTSTDEFPDRRYGLTTFHRAPANRGSNAETLFLPFSGKTPF